MVAGDPGPAPGSLRSHLAPALGRRALLGATSEAAAGAGALLTSGFFKPEQLGHLDNMLLTATLSNDVYPWAAHYKIGLADVADGLTAEQDAHWQAIFRAKWTALGASSVQFLHFYPPDYVGANQFADRPTGHATVLGTPQDVWLVFRGTTDLGQIAATGNFATHTWRILGAELELYHAPWGSMQGLWPKVLPAVRAALARTRDPAAARVFVTGHSLGGASAALGALLLKEAGLNVGGVWAFEPYKIGKTCAADEDCWVSVYRRHLGDKTWMIWNNQDPIPLLLDIYHNTSLANSSFGHVYGDKHLLRIAGERCHSDAAGTPLELECPPEVDAADGSADGACASPFGDHLPWVVLKRIAHCALLQPPASARRLTPQQAAQTRRVWTSLLGLSLPPGL